MCFGDPSLRDRGKGSLRKGSEFPESLESLDNGQILLCFPHSGVSLQSLASLESLESGHLEKTPFPEDPVFRFRSLMGRTRVNKLCPQNGDRPRTKLFMCFGFVITQRKQLQK